MAKVLSVIVEGQEIKRRTDRPYKYVVVGKLAHDRPRKKLVAGQWIGLSWSTRYELADRKAKEARTYIYPYCKDTTGKYPNAYSEVRIVEVLDRDGV